MDSIALNDKKLSYDAKRFLFLTAAYADSLLIKTMNNKMGTLDISLYRDIDKLDIPIVSVAIKQGERYSWILNALDSLVEIGYLEYMYYFSNPKREKYIITIKGIQYFNEQSNYELLQYT